MKKWVAGFVVLFSIVATVSVGLAAEGEGTGWKKVLSDAIEYGGFVEPTMMQDALQVAVSNGVSISEFFAEVKAINPVALEVALKSGFAVVPDKGEVMAAALETGVDEPMMVRTAVSAGVPAEEVIPGAIEMGAPTRDVVEGAIAGGAGVDAVVQSALAADNDLTAVTDGCLAAGVSSGEVTTSLLTAGAEPAEVVSTVMTASDDDVAVVASSMAAGVPVHEIEAGARAANVPSGAIEAMIESVKSGLAYTTPDGRKASLNQARKQHAVRVQNRAGKDVSPY